MPCSLNAQLPPVPAACGGPQAHTPREHTLASLHHGGHHAALAPTAPLLCPCLPAPLHRRNPPPHPAPPSLLQAGTAAREVLHHMSIQHPHVIALQEVFLTSEYIVLVLEHAPEGSLAEHMKNSKGLAESEARWLFQQASQQAHHHFSGGVGIQYNVHN